MAGAPEPAAVALGHRFADPELLRQALTHRSAAARNNERLEFLGDALLGAIIAEALHQRFPKADEGALTRARSRLVREAQLAALARAEGLGERLILGPGELKSGGYRRDSILADAVEALIGAVHLDGGFEVCRGCVLGLFDPLLQSLPAGLKAPKDAKTRLQEWLQARQLDLPEYPLLAAHGEDHDKRFEVACRVVKFALESHAVAGSRREAEQQAAAEVLAALLELNSKDTP
ncbi:MAG: ribonuclease III [Aquimonas sp.]|nr:ribonuclease III [Aquimonas sp.]